MHRVSDYTESDLTVALSSPFNTPEREDELIAEYYRRQDFYRQQIETVTPIK